MSSIQYYNFVAKQLPLETVEQTIAFSLMNLKSLIAYYIPTDLVNKYKSQMFPVLHEMLEKDIPASIKSAVVDQLWGFLSSKNDVEMALKWVENGQIQDKDEKKDLFELKQSHNMSIVKVINKSTHVSETCKMELLDKVLGEDKSDLAKQCRMTCEASRNHLGVKKATWNELVDPKSKLSLYERRAMMFGFYSWDQIDTCTPFFDMFYDSLEELYKVHTYKYIEIFFYYCCFLLFFL